MEGEIGVFGVELVLRDCEGVVEGGAFSSL